MPGTVPKGGEVVGGGKRSAMQWIEDSVVITSMYLKGYSQAAIATWLSKNRKYTLSTVTIGKDLRKIRESWRERALSNYGELVDQQLMKLDLIEKTLWEAWVRSVGEVKEESTKGEGRAELVETVTEKGVERKAKIVTLPSKTTRTTKIRYMAGDPSYMAGITRVIELRCKILGVLSPEVVMQYNQQLNVGGTREGGPTVHVYVPIRDRGTPLDGEANSG